MSDLGDDELIRLHCDGDADAFDALFDRHYVSVYNFARLMLHDAGAAEEVLQETFLAVAQAARAYQPRGHFRTWLLRIVRNRCLNRLAALRAQHELLADSGLSVVEPASPEASPSRRLEADETAAAVRAMVEKLPDRQREAIVLYAFERMKYRQIAEALDVPIDTVKTLIHRARAALAAALEDRFKGEARDV